jgi:PPM family protein phosphatase
MSEQEPLCVLGAAKSDPGRDPDKQVNEDACRISVIGGGLLAVVCDGMGGHVGGRVASHTAVDTILTSLAQASPERPTRDRLKQAIAEASEAVYRIGGDAPTHERPGATCVAAWLHAATLHVAHVGDSRCYRWRASALQPLTRDHSVIEAFIQAGQVARAEAHLHPDAHRITRALGIQPKVEVELQPTETLLRGDKLLLCSDGLTDLVAESELGELLSRAKPLDQLASELVSLANARGGHDNVTVVLLETTDWASARGRPEVAAAAAQSNASMYYVLSTSAVLATSTEQFTIPETAAHRTVPLVSTDRTILMLEERQDHPRGPARFSPDPKRDIGKTQPLVQFDAKAAFCQGSQAPESIRRPTFGPSPRRLWILFGVALVLVGLAVAIGLIRR